MQIAAESLELFTRLSAGSPEIGCHFPLYEFHGDRFSLARTDALLSEFSALRPRLLRYIIARTRNQADADEILQETWIKLENRKSEEIEHSSAYIFRTADNCIRDRTRARLRRERREAAWVEAESANSQIDERADQERALISREALANVQNALDRLPERTCYIFRSCRIDGRKHKHLADELGISISAVEKHMHRAYAAILCAREQYDEDNDAGGVYTAGPKV